MTNKKILQRLIQKGWHASEYQGKNYSVNSDLEAITHEIAHLIALKQSFEVCSGFMVNKIIKKHCPTHKDQDDNELDASAITSEVLNQLGISHLYKLIVENVQLNITQKHLFKATEEEILDILNKRRSTERIQNCSKQILNYYKTICHG